MFQILDSKNGAALAEHQTVAVSVERPTRLLRLVIAPRQWLEQALAHHAQRVDFALGAADQEEVGPIAGQDAVGFAQRQQAGHVAFGDGVVGALGVVQDGDVAGKHVGQILEHPQRLDGRNALLAPLFQIDHAGLAVGAECGGVGQLQQFAGDQAGAELDAEARRVEFVLVHLAVVEGAAGPPTTASSMVRAIIFRLRRSFLSTNCGRRSRDLAGDADGQAGGVEGADGADAAAPLEESFPDGGRIQAEGAE